MQFAAIIGLISLSLWAQPSYAGCFMTAAQFTEIMGDSDPDHPTQIYFLTGEFSGFVQGVFDSYAALAFFCPPELTVGDAQTLVRRHFKSVLDKHDALPSRTCAEDVLMTIFMERFPCRQPDESTSMPPGGKE